MSPDAGGVAEGRPSIQAARAPIPVSFSAHKSIIGHSPLLAEEFEVRTGVVINEGNILVRLWRIAALNHVVRMTRNDDSGHARHADNLLRVGRKANK